MPTLAGDYAVARIVYASDQRVQDIMVLHYMISGTVDDPFSDVQDLANAIDSELSVAFPAVLCTTSKFYGVACALHSGGVVYNARSVGVADAGTVMGDESADFVAVVIQKRSAHPGRSGTGRWFVGCVPETLTDTNRLTAGGRTAYDNLALALNTDIIVGGATYQTAIYSQKDNALYQMLATDIDGTLATQRRRLVRPIF
jgi:hypothetical protein